MYKEETNYGKRLFIWFIVVILLISGAVTMCNTVWSTGKKAIHADDAVETYEEFQSIYNTCQKLNTDLSIIQSTPDDDKQFEQFSKAQRLNAIKQNLNRWVEEYNAKSKMWGRSLWKSKSLPYQLSVTDFSNYK